MKKPEGHKHYFILKVIRNSAILALGYFASTFVEFEDFSFDEWKALLTFVMLYLAAELAHHYKVSTTEKKANLNIKPLLF